jgi:hypothetical protein
MYATPSWKILGAWARLLEVPGWSHVYVTNSSSYGRIDELVRCIKDLPQVGLNAGAPGKQGPRTFASGSNRLFSRDVVSQILEARRQLDRGLLEDLAIGDLFTRLGIVLTPLRTAYLSNAKEVAPLDDHQLRSCFHFRVKALSGSILEQTDMMTLLHRRVATLER